MAVLLPNGIDIDDTPLAIKGRALLLSSGYDGGLYTQLVAGGCFVDQIKLSPLLAAEQALLAHVPKEGTTSIVAVGDTSILDMGKVLAAHYSLPLYVLPTGYVGTAFTRWAVTYGDKIKLWQAPPYEVRLLPSLLSHATRIDAAETYAYAVECYMQGVAVLTSDWLGGKEENGERLTTALAALDEVLTAVSGYGAETAKTVWEGLTAFCRHLPDEISEGHLYSFLISLYKNGQTVYNKYRFAAALSMGEALRLAPDVPDLLFPCDQVEALRDMSGASPIRWKEDYAVKQHVWQDYRADVEALLDHLGDYARRWRRIVGDCGYGYYQDLKASDLTRCLRQTCHFTPRYTALKHLYRQGWLDVADKGERYGLEQSQTVFDGHGRDGVLGQTGDPRRV